MNNFETRIRKILGDKIEHVMKLGNSMILIQLNRKQERLSINAQVDIRDIEKLGLRFWDMNFDNKTLTFDIVK